MQAFVATSPGAALAAGGCPLGDRCQLPDCAGNRLQLRRNNRTGGDWLYEIIIPHHKVSHSSQKLCVHCHAAMLTFSLTKSVA